MADESILIRLLELPLAEMFEALDALQELDEYLLFRMQNEGSPEQIIETEKAIESRKLGRFQLIDFRLTKETERLH